MKVTDERSEESDAHSESAFQQYLINQKSNQVAPSVSGDSPAHTDSSRDNFEQGGGNWNRDWNEVSLKEKESPVGFDSEGRFQAWTQ